MRLRLLRMKSDGGAVYMRNANNGEMLPSEVTTVRGRDESLLVQTSDQCSGAAGLPPAYLSKSYIGL